MIYRQPKIDFTIPAMREWRKLPEDVFAEVINQTLYVSSPPTPFHARVSGRIFNMLTNHVEANELGEIFCAPVGVVLTGGTNVVLPDIVFISKDNPVIVDRRGIHGPPDLHIEILSPSTKRRDLTIKKHLYETAGVKEYWIVHPETKNAQGFILKNGKYGDPLLLNSEIYIRILKKTIRF